MDRSVRKILSLPLFGDDFCQWLVDLRMAQFEKLCAVSDGTIDECVQAFVNLVPALEAQYSPAHQKTEEELARWVPIIEILFALVRNTAKTGTADLAVDLGFGLAEVSVATGRSPLKSKRDSNEPPLPLPLAKRPRAIEPRSDEAQDSLKAREIGEARKWGMRLRAIVERCGEHATIAGGPKPGSPLSQEEMNALRSIVYESGGFRTIQQCVRHWERLETWARSQNINAIPLTTEVLVKYILDLADRGCGPTVIPSVRGAVKWICKRIGMQAPDLGDARIMALQKRVYSERGKETREAVPIPLALVAALERFVCSRFRSGQFVMAFFAWWILIMIYSSLRFDDAMHVVPEALAMKDEALYGVVWQTKVERQKKGTRFAVAKVSVTGEEWMEDGWSAASFEMDERDYFMKELDSAERFGDRPATYQRSVLWLRYVLTTAASDDLKRGLISPPDLKGHLQLIQEITWHSCRVTLLSAAVQAQVPDKEIGLQANWKNPSQLVLKYARSRKEISIEMVKRLTKRIASDWKSPPEFEAEDSNLVDFGDCSLTYVTKARSSSAPAKDLNLKYHAMYIDGTGAERTLCGRYKITECDDLGEIPPSSQMCSLCAGKIFADP